MFENLSSISIIRAWKVKSVFVRVHVVSTSMSQDSRQQSSIDFLGISFITACDDHHLMLPLDTLPHGSDVHYEGLVGLRLLFVDDLLNFINIDNRRSEIFCDSESHENRTFNELILGETLDVGLSVLRLPRVASFLILLRELLNQGPLGQIEDQSSSCGRDSADHKSFSSARLTN